MTRHNPETLTDYPELPETGRKSSDLSRPERRNSKLGHIMDSIRHALVQEDEKSPGHKPPTQYKGEPDLASPAIQADKSAKLNENNMGVDSHQPPSSWGWPGLGSFTTSPVEAVPTRRKSSTKTATERIAMIEPKVEAAAFEAIDNAAESELYGWPGLGDWSATRK